MNPRRRRVLLLGCHCENPALAGDEAIAHARVDRHARQAGLVMTMLHKMRIRADQAAFCFRVSRNNSVETAKHAKKREDHETGTILAVPCPRLGSGILTKLKATKDIRET